jgi:hypothetical protein
VLLTLVLAVVLPIGLVLWVYVHEIRDLGTWGRMNPLGVVASRLMDQVETQINAGQQQIQTVAADPALADPAQAREALRRYATYVDSGRFKVLALEFPDGTRYTLPEAPPGSWRADMTGRPAEGVSELIPGPDGGWLLAMSAPLGGADAPEGRLTGLFDVSGVLGQAMLDRMQVARWGEAFIADREGRIFLSANPGLEGHSLAELGLAGKAGPDGLYTAEDFRTADGQRHFVAVAESHGYYEGPQNGWKVGLMVPESVVGARSRGMTTWIQAVIASVLVITAALALVLRHSMRGAPR